MEKCDISHELTLTGAHIHSLSRSATVADDDDYDDVDDETIRRNGCDADTSISHRGDVIITIIRVRLQSLRFMNKFIDHNHLLVYLHLIESDFDLNDDVCRWGA